MMTDEVDFYWNGFERLLRTFTRPSITDSEKKIRWLLGQNFDSLNWSKCRQVGAQCWSNSRAVSALGLWIWPIVLQMWVLSTKQATSYWPRTDQLSYMWVVSLSKQGASLLLHQFQRLCLLTVLLIHMLTKLALFQHSFFKENNSCCTSVRD